MSLQDLPNQLNLEGPNNFRDMGGYPLSGGARLQRHRIYRSDHLANLTDEDQKQLTQLGIRTVIDLRRQSEREESPDRLQDPAVKQLWLPIDAEGADIRKLRRGLETGAITATRAQQYLVQANIEFVRSFATVYAAFFEVLLEPASYPVVFHCTAGKDRAGFAAALVLFVAGASRETVFHDYLATNHCTAHYVNGIVEGLGDMPEMKASPEAVRTLMQVREEYLQAALDVIDEDYGSIGGFLDGPLRLGDRGRAQIRAMLCKA